jgi:hypothetical protein
MDQGHPLQCGPGSTALAGMLRPDQFAVNGQSSRGRITEVLRSLVNAGADALATVSPRALVRLEGAVSRCCAVRGRR